MPLETTPIVGLPADRLYDWNPGLDSVGGVPDRTTIFTTVYPGGDIQAAIDACPSGEVVQLAAGTFTVNNFLLINKDITLRGAVDPVTNAPLTVLQKTNGATPGSYTAPDYQPIIIVGPGRYNNQTGTSTNLTSDAVAGTYSVTLASTAGLSPGGFVLLDEDDYTNASFIPLPDRNGSPTSAEILASDRVVFMDHSPSDPGDDPFPDSLTWFSRMGRPLNELKEIASISGNTVTFTSPITITYTVSKTAQLTSFDDTFVKYAGIENLSLKGGSDGNVRFEDAAYSWMKNCEDTNWLGEGVAIDSSFRIEVRGSYIHDGAWPEPGGGGYAISLAAGSAEALIENNIILRANKMMVGRSAGAGTVVAYNYTDDGFILTYPSWQEVGINGSHMAGSHSWLFEGNESFNYDSDNTHGNAIYMTVFRNDLTGDRTDFSNPEDNARAVGLMFGSWWQSILGNVLGTPGQMTDWTYQSPGLGNQWGNDNIWEIGYDPQHWEQDADPKTVSTLIQGGNYDSVTDSVHWEDIPSQTLPNSLYLSGKPAFFGSYTWPWVDPTGSTQLYILPAKARYDAGTPFVIAVCYARGTMIRTPDEELPVEKLRPGKQVITVLDGQEIPQTVTWLGHRRIDLAGHPRPETVAPIRIRRDAFADGMPHRDLMVSPDHAIFVDGKLICARQLVNGTTIRQERDWTAVDYYHVELDQHAILLAEGLPAESYIDTGNSGFFANSGPPLVLHPDLTDVSDYPTREAGSCAPFVSDEANVQPVWQRLADRAAATRLLGSQPVTTTEADLRLLADQRNVRPVFSDSDRVIFVLPRGAGEVQLLSRAQSPTEARPWLDDRRRLGVRVKRIVLRGADEVREVPMDHPDLTKGWWGVERDGQIMSRWTDGEAVLPLPVMSGTVMLEIHLAGSMIYAVDAAPEDRTERRAAA